MYVYFPVSYKIIFASFHKLSYFAKVHVNAFT